MKQKEKSNGSLRERWATCWTECWTERLAGRIAGAISAEEMRMWPLTLRTLALNLRAGIPLQEAVYTDPSSGQLGESAQFGQGELGPGTGKPCAKRSARALRVRGLSPLSEDYGRKRCAEDIRRFMQTLATVTSWGAPRAPRLRPTARKQRPATPAQPRAPA